MADCPHGVPINSSEICGWCDMGAERLVGMVVVIGVGVAAVSATVTWREVHHA